MEAKSKALELIEKYNKYAHSNPAHDSELFYRRLKENSIACALIAVEEILNNDNNFFNTYSQNDYWLQVKQEILKL
jgi:hypothetical protein